MEESNKRSKQQNRFIEQLIRQTWLFVLMMILMLATAGLAQYPLVTFHRFDQYKMLFYAGGIGLSAFLFLASLAVKQNKQNRFGIISFFVLLLFVFPGILFISQVLFDIERFIPSAAEGSLLFACMGLFGASLLLSVSGLFRRGRKADFLLSLAVFMLYMSQIIMPRIFKLALYDYQEKHPGCHTTLHILSKSCIVAQSYEDQMWTQRNRWCDFLHQEFDVTELRKFRCPEDILGPCSYAMNENIPADGKKLPDDLVILFEAAPGWNQVGGPDDVVTDRHGKPGANIAFADGHVEFVDAEVIPTLRWTLDDSGPKRQ